MLVDLGRNDLGRVCRPGTVKVSAYRHIERYSHVMHLVSTVSGHLADGKTALDAVAACFPAGTLSGAPKVRAMELIDELEPTRRGIYGGIVGYLDFAGDADTAITIRTALVKDGTAYVQAGAGIVADSDPEYEDTEARNKAMAVLSAIAAAQTVRAYVTGRRRWLRTNRPAPRSAALPLILLALGAGLMWVSSRMTWVRVTSADGLGTARTDELNGGTWFGALTPLALALLAAIAAVLATRGWVRRVVGVVIALIAAAAAVPPMALLTGTSATADRAVTLADLPGRAEVVDVATFPFPAALALAGAVVAFAAGVLLTRKPPATAGLSSRYDAPATRRAQAGRDVRRDVDERTTSQRTLWDALDAGHDPTTDTDPTPPNHRGRPGEQSP